MLKSIVLVLLSCVAAIGQSGNAGTPGSSSQSPTAQHAQPATADISPATPVITINGVCDHPSGQKPGPDCKTVITKAQFEAMVQTIQPNLPASARRDFAQHYVEALVIDEKARTMGVNQGKSFDVRTRIAHTQALAQELNVTVYDDGSKVSDKEIEDYYHNNPDLFVEAELTRMLIPGIQQLPAPTEKLSDAEQDKRNQESEAIMRAEAEKLRTRAVAGEPLEKLQAEAFQLAMVQGNAPNVDLGTVKGSDLPASQISVMELNAGEVSTWYLDKRGYLVYKVGKKRTIPLSEAREDIRKKLADQHRQDEMNAILKPSTPILDEVYFGK